MLNSPFTKRKRIINHPVVSFRFVTKVWNFKLSHTTYEDLLLNFLLQLQASWNRISEELLDDRRQTQSIQVSFDAMCQVCGPNKDRQIVQGPC